MDFILAIFFILVVTIFSGVLRSLVNKSVNKNANGSSNRDEELPTFNDNTYVEEEIEEEQKPEIKKEGLHDLIEMFQEYSLKKKNEVFSKDSYINKYTTSSYDNQKPKKVKEKTKQKSDFDQVKFDQEQKKEVLDTLNIAKEQENILDSAKKVSALEKIKRLSYLKQAIVLSEVLGRPKGLDI